MHRPVSLIRATARRSGAKTASPAAQDRPHSASSAPPRSTLLLIAGGGVLTAAVVAYLTARNPLASPPGVLGPLARAVDILSLVGAGLFAMVRHPEERLGRMLVALGLFSGLFFLNGAENPYLYSVSMLVGIFAVPAYNYVLLSFPEGRLHSRLERRLTFGAIAVIAVGWIPLWLISRQPAIAPASLHCLPACPRNVMFVGSVPWLHDLTSRLVRAGYAALTLGVVFVLTQRLRRASRLTRIMLGPVLVVSIAYAVILALTLLVGERASAPLTIVDWLLLAAVPAVPVAVVGGLIREELFLKRALEGLVSGIAGAETPLELRSLMNDALGDDSLRLVFWSDRHHRFADLHGTPVYLPAPGLRLRQLPRALGGGHGPAAAIVVDAALADDPRFLRAVTAAAAMAIHRYQLDADLRMSRRRLIAAADRERERLERNLHDGVQQRLVALRVRLGLANEAIAAPASDGGQLYEALDQELAAAIEELREVAHGLYPHLLDRFGLPVALQAATRRSAHPATVTDEQVGRYGPELELAVYFCCLEALQNADKHAGPDARTAIRLWQEDAVLHFEVSDRGKGFELADRERAVTAPGAEPAQSGGVGLQNMRDRIGAVGGALSIRSAVGRGTSVAGAVPVGLSSARFTRATAEAADTGATSPGSEDVLPGARR